MTGMDQLIFDDDAAEDGLIMWELFYVSPGEHI